MGGHATATARACSRKISRMACLRWRRLLLMWSWMLEVSTDTLVIVHLHLLGCTSIMYLAVMSFTPTK